MVNRHLIKAVQCSFLHVEVWLTDI